MHKAKVLFPTGHRLFRFCAFLFCFCLPLTLVIYGAQFINLSTVAIIFAAMPVAILLVSIVVLNAPTSLLQLAGASLALMSLLFFLQETFRDATSDSWKGALSVVIAVIMYACLYVQRKKRVRGVCSSVTAVERKKRASKSQLNLN